MHNGTLSVMGRVLVIAAVLLSGAGDQAWAQAPRQASAMQRVTGVLRPRHALERLDSVLAVRVYDARGAELAGVAVQWTLSNAGDGAARSEERRVGIEYGARESPKRQETKRVGGMR